jgi:hypothetical protein
MSKARSDALADALCDEIASGASIKQACETHGVARKEFYRWLNSDEKFDTRITHARVRQQESLVEEMREIADSATAEDFQVARLRIWQRQWEAARLAPKKYGDKLQQEVTGADGKPLVIEWKGPDANSHD